MTPRIGKRSALEGFGVFKGVSAVRCMASLAIACLYLIPTAIGQPPVEPGRNKVSKQPAKTSPQFDQLRAAERTVGTTATGIGLAIVGFAAIGWAVWIARPVFWGDSTIHKISVVGLVVAGVLLIGAGVDLATAGFLGASVDWWLNQQG